MDNKTKQVIYRTVHSWADGVGIVSVASQEKLFNSLVANLEAVEQPAPADGYCSCSNKHEHYEKHDDYEVCLVCGNPRR